MTTRANTVVARAHQALSAAATPGTPVTLITTAGGPPVTLHRFAAGPRRRLVIAGVHGSELSGVEVAERVLARLAERPVEGTDTLVIPCLFPDHAAIGLREGAIPTNRNFPPRGHGLAGDDPRDAMGRPILPENGVLMAVVAAFQPDRIATLHATVHPERAGVFADPHARADGQIDPDATAADAALSLALAGFARAHGARVPGNALDQNGNSVWGGEVADGVSLGTWGPAPVTTPADQARPAIGIITVEIDGLIRSDAPDAPPDRARELDAFARMVVDGFLRDPSPDHVQSALRSS